MRTKLLLGNSGKQTDKTTNNLLVEEVVTLVGDDSKTVYINDSYNLNSIPFDTVSFIEKDELEDTE